ncbi:hypothetical protein GCM10010517_80800 [Streptosporangium fragile]|uniref:SH3 domain-containing protein n=1 Tax=Streptosporangium fragile TaxID=46186 RepID=A0ABP6IYR0_9ACTN
MRITAVVAALLAGAALTAAAPAALAGTGHTAIRAGAAQASETKYWVDTFATATGFYRGGFLYAGTHYVFCKRRGDRVGTADQYNHWWLLTDMDTGGRDYVSAYYLSRWGNDEARDNSGREIPNC